MSEQESRLQPVSGAATSWPPTPRPTTCWPLKSKMQFFFAASIINLILFSQLLPVYCTPKPTAATSNTQSQQPLKPISPQTHKHAPNGRAKRAATARQDRLWDDAVIPYEIDSIFSDERAALFRSAMRHWENYTCIKFVERQPEEHRNYIVFTERSCGCCSFVGKRGNGAQAISIGKHCDKFGIVVHELGHVVGFWHEHTRPDRDQHVQIISKNIMSGQEYNFNKLTKDEVNSLGLAYDYDSILHYATNTFAKDTYLDTILPLHGHLNTEVAMNQHIQLAPATLNTTTSALNSNITSTGGSLELHGRHLSGSLQPARTINSSSSSPNMINDATALKTQLEQDFQSMLLFKPSSSQQSSYSSSNQSSKLVLLDGSVVVRVAGKASPFSQSPAIIGHHQRMKRGSVDRDDAEHMISMDNMLAKTRPEIGQRIRLSVGDIAQTNLLYRCPKCGRTIQQTSGVFHSPNYYHSSQARNEDETSQTSFEEQNEEQNRESRQQQPLYPELCEWRLTAGPGERVMINLTDFDLPPPSIQSTFSGTIPGSTGRLGMPKTPFNDLESIDSMSPSPTGHAGQSNHMVMSNCVTDYIEIRDGYTHRAPLIAKLCGHITSIKDLIKPFVSTGNRLLVSLRTSSASLGKRGFLARHETLCGGIILLGNSRLNEQMRSTFTQSSNIIHKSLHGERTITGPTISIPATTNQPVVQNRVYVNGTSPSENEVLLSSQTNFRPNQLQSQQLISASNDASHTETVRTSNGGSISQQQLNGSSKAFGWDHWPPINASTIQSPNWPEHYRPSKECLWHVKADENHQVSVRFESFDLESHDSCAYDYVEIRDGPNLSNEVIGRFCGNRIPEQILSSGQSLLIKFVSDSDVNRPGFMVSLQPELDECKLGTTGCSYRCSNAAIPYRCECPNGLELAADGKNCIPICGGARNESSGLITSPSFPDLYPISTKCIWEITAPENHRITLNFTHFDLEGIKAQDCDYDFVDIRSRIKDGKYVKNGVFCGPNQALVVTSIANVMRIEFNSDNSIQKSGFMANYFVDRDECATNNGGCQHLCTNTIGSFRCSCNNGFQLHENKHDCFEGNCSHSISASDGFFHSPNYPNSYQPNKDCAWAFATAPGHRIKLQFDHFELENHQECSYDHVALFDGESIDSPSLGRYCGSRRPHTLVSSFNLLYLLFHSDATNEKRGFNATHSAVCGGRLQANLNTNDLIYSHPQFDGTVHYGRNEDCQWLIEAIPNQKIKIEFTFFALEADNNCNYDHVLVYDGSDDTAVSPMARLCGNDIPRELSKLTSSGEFMLIVFRSDDSINNRGFSLTYTAIETSEDEPVAITYPTGTKYTQSS